MADEQRQTLSGLERPIIVVGPPNSGHAAMRESLRMAPGTWEVDAELDETTAAVGDALRADLSAHFSAVDLRRIPGDAVPRLVRVTSPRAPHLSSWTETFPDAVVIYLRRTPVDALAGTPAGTEGGPALDRVAGQWARLASDLLDDLERLDPAQRYVADTAALMAEPEDETQRLFDFLGLGWHGGCTVAWQALSLAVVPEEALDLSSDSRFMLEDVDRRVQALHLGPVVGMRTDTETLTRVTASSETTHDRATHARQPRGEVEASDDGLGSVLERHGCSLLVTTYQSDRVIILRQDKGALGLDLRGFDRPMGIATTSNGLAIGTRTEVWDLQDLPGAAAKLEPVGERDACYLPRNSHVTGDIAVHDLGLGREGLWVVATKFSCLATLDATHSFVPRWRPPFVSATVPEDRCHLNGMALVDGEPRYVTALGTSDTRNGWRADKAFGGVVMEVPSGEVVARGLSMPHSPRWHDGRLWVLESGRGRLSVCDPAAGTTEPVVELPGFTRGLRFSGTTAFIGTSQIRETATFGGLPIASLPRRECGVWAVDTRSGEVLGSVRFDQRVEELFDVAVVEGKRWPEVVEPGSPLTHNTWSVASEGSLP